jgi:hypothetical protein
MEKSETGKITQKMRGDFENLFTALLLPECPENPNT